MNGNNAIYFDSFGVEHIPKEIWKFIGYKNIITNIYRIQAYGSIMCVLWYNRNSFLPSVNQTLGIYIFLIVLKIEGQREIYDVKIQTWIF